MLIETGNDQKFRAVSKAIGISLLIYYLFLSAESLGLFLSLTPMGAFFQFFSQILFPVLGASVSVLVFKAVLNKPGREGLYVPFSARPSLPFETPLYVLSAVALVRLAAFLNSGFIGQLAVFTIPEPYTFGPDVELSMMAITVAMVAGFFEELMFRGCICQNLIRFGKMKAIVISAMFFSLMHGNLSQLFYTFVAGLIFGWFYVKTGSIWLGVITHFCNNLFSLLFSFIAQQTTMHPEEIVGVMMLFYAAAFLSACALAVIMIVRKKRSTGLSASSFDRVRQTLNDEEPYIEYMPAKRVIRNLITVPNVIFFVLIAGSIISVAFFQEALYG